MTASRALQRAVGIGMLVVTVGLYWLIAKGCDLASPQLKWFVIPAMLAFALFVLARSFFRDVKKYVDATHAYARRDIDTAALPRHSDSSLTIRHYSKSLTGLVRLRA